jgi:hypothetical protein
MIDEIGGDFDEPSEHEATSNHINGIVSCCMLHATERITQENALIELRIRVCVFHDVITVSLLVIYFANSEFDAVWDLNVE